MMCHWDDAHGKTIFIRSIFQQLLRVLVDLLLVVRIRYSTIFLLSCFKEQHIKGVPAVSSVQTSPGKEKEVEIIFSFDLSLGRETLPGFG